MAKRQRKRRRERREEHARRRGWQTRHSVITGAGIAATATLGLTGVAHADAYTYWVGSNGDTTGATDCLNASNTDCTLRDAINAANANSGQYDYVVFRPTVTGNVALTAGEIPITDAVYIYGNGPDVNTITADANSRIFNVNPNNGDVVAIYGLTLTGGDVTGDGGAIQNDDAILRVTDSILSGNSASGVGGAVFEPGNYYGGVYDRFRYSTFFDNHADSGGAIYATNSWGRTRQATFNDNGAPFGDGGAIAGDAGYLIDSTISGNSAAVAGGGVAIFDEIRFYGTIVANNSDSGIAPDVYAPGGGFGSFDLVETVGPLSFPPSIITGQDPQLGPLQNNGGYTPTLKPAAGSPVVDQSYSYYYYDQRFQPRIIDNPNKANVAGGNGADIGAVELSVAEGPQATPVSPPPPAPPAKKKKKCKKKKHRFAVSAKKKCKKKKRSASAPRIRFAVPSKAEPSWPGDPGRHPFRLRH
jgi:Chlamydia polymorphic membrane protein (Chlamydia_PMP) repeat